MHTWKKFSIFNQKRNTNENYFEIAPHFSQNENKTKNASEDTGKKKHLYTVGGSIN
jgi:hypothetical protein